VPASQFFPLSGCLVTATAMQAAMAASMCRLFQSTFTPDASNVLADYVAAEATYSGYDALEFTTWFAPILAPGTGYMIGSPIVQFAFTASPGTPTNIIGGCFVVDSAANLRIAIIFDQPIPMQMAGQGIPLNIVWLFPTGL
jgi:uncharacterized protein (DUF697 family)